MEIVFNSQTFSLQHYTKDADGLCTRLIKPKLMEGTVAAQDEFSRSKRAHYTALQGHWHQYTQGHFVMLVFICHINLTVSDA